MGLRDKMLLKAGKIAWKHATPEHRALIEFRTLEKIRKDHPNATEAEIAQIYLDAMRPLIGDVGDE